MHFGDSGVATCSVCVRTYVRRSAQFDLPNALLNQWTPRWRTRCIAPPGSKCYDDVRATQRRFRHACLRVNPKHWFMFFFGARGILRAAAVHTTYIHVSRILNASTSKKTSVGLSAAPFSSLAPTCIVIQECRMSTEGDSALITASSPPLILMGLPLFPAVTLSTRSVYVPSERKTVSPALAFPRASGRL